MENRILANCCKKHLDLRNAKLSDEYYYKSLPMCIIDAVFSIGIRYTITRNVVINFCRKAQIQRLRDHGTEFPPIECQFSVKSLLELYDEYSIDEITDRFYQNRNRTSSRSGILKSEAVLRFAKVLEYYGINYFQDLSKLIGNDEFEKDIKQIPGQSSGKSTSYFYMLAGEENYIKADRMIIRFIKYCTGRIVDVGQASSLIIGALDILKEEFPDLTPRKLDHEIWKYQKNLTTYELHFVKRHNDKEKKRVEFLLF